ncbi:MAG: alpha-glucan family phosphorylase [Candidatus Nanohaloarchaea archaeon]
MSRSVAYFSMEIGVKPEIKTYSGGLGILAGDTLKSAADLGEDFTAVTLLYRDGYFSQRFEDGYQKEENDNWNYSELLEDTGESITIEIFEEEVEAKIWKHTIESKSNVDIYFLDTGLEKNSEEAKNLTSQLYGGDDRTRLGQEVLLGIGGVKALNQLEINPEFYHMNEGHSALSTLEADGEFIFTTHTPVAAGHDKFDRGLVDEVLGNRASDLDIEDELNMTEQALKHASYSNAVSKKHEEVTEQMFPNYEFGSVTNGVHSESWTSEEFQDLFDNYVDGWRDESARLGQALKIPDSEIWDAKIKSKKELQRLVKEKNGGEIDLGSLTIGFARRMTGYKRPTLIFKDLESLDKLGEKYGGLQLVFGGKAHPADTQGKELIQKIIKYGDMLDHVDVYFVEDYSIEDSLTMIAGSDVWLNTPHRGQEASGTSGMKAMHNATPQLSVLDGWWLEGHIEDVTGWSIGEDYVEGENEDEIDSKSVYRKLDHIISMYENERQEWLEIMKNCIAINAAYFNTDRMVKEYINEAYK